MIRFTTESGSIYEVDFEGRRFRKVKTTESSRINEFPWQKFITLHSRETTESPLGEDDQIRVGYQYLFSNFDIWIKTSAVVSIEETP